MNQGLGPVVGNRFDDARKTALKPHLMERLVANTVRAVPLGTMVTEDDGRMAFVPNYTHTTERAASKAAPAEGDDEREAMALIRQAFNISAKPLSRDELAKVMGFTSINLPADVLTFFSPDCAGHAKPAPAFDPMTEPLQLGDYVEVVYRGNGVAVKETGKRGTVRQCHPIRGVKLQYDDGTADEGCGWGERSSLKLLARKATS